MLKQNFLFKSLYKLHIYIGIFITINFVILALSGLLLLFKDEIQGNPQISTQTEPYSQALFAEKYDQALTNLRRMYPTDRPLDMYPDERNAQIIGARLGRDGSTKLQNARIVNLDFNSGQELAPQADAPGAPFFNWILRLHRELFLGSSGRIYMGFVGITYVFMMLSGFLIYCTLMKRRPLKNLWSTARIPKLVDLHKFFGIISFAWGLIVGLTGMFLAFEMISIKNFQEQNLKHLTEQYQVVNSLDSQATAQITNTKTAPFRDIINTAFKSKPDSIIWYIVFPDMERGIPGHYLILAHGTTPLTQQFSEYLVINAKTAKLAEIVTLPISMQAALVSRPLHFANYGGVFLKIVWALFTIISLAVALLGVCSRICKKTSR